MSGTRVAAVLGVLSFHVMAAPSSGGGVVVYEELVTGFAPHVHLTGSGRIDWTGGFIMAEGRGIAESTDDQGQLMAKRGATIVAARNALAVAAGINVDAGGRVEDVPNGRVTVEGLIKGHEVVDVTWRADLDPPEMRVQLRVPLWGAKSVASIFHDHHRRRMVHSGARRVPLVMARVDVSESVLVIDARGTGLETSLFPIVVTDNGDLLYDVGRLLPETAKLQAPARYVETDMTYEQLRACVEDGDRAPDRPGPGVLRARLVSYGDPAVSPPEESGPATSQPSSQPAKKTRRRARRRVAVKAAAASGECQTRIVVTGEDAEKLRRSAEGASLLREGQVVIVVDSAAAGIQGRHRPSIDERTLLAWSPSP